MTVARDFLAEEVADEWRAWCAARQIAPENCAVPPEDLCAAIGARLANAAIVERASAAGYFKGAAATKAEYDKAAAVVPSISLPAKDRAELETLRVSHAKIQAVAHTLAELCEILPLHGAGAMPERLVGRAHACGVCGIDLDAALNGSRFMVSGGKWVCTPVCRPATTGEAAPLGRGGRAPDGEAATLLSHLKVGLTGPDIAALPFGCLSPVGNKTCDACDTCLILDSLRCSCGRKFYDHSWVAPHGIEGTCTAFSLLSWRAFPPSENDKKRAAEAVTEGAPKPSAAERTIALFPENGDAERQPKPPTRTAEPIHVGDLYGVPWTPLLSATVRAARAWSDSTRNDPWTFAAEGAAAEPWIAMRDACKEQRMAWYALEARAKELDARFGTPSPFLAAAPAPPVPAAAGTAAAPVEPVAAVKEPPPVAAIDSGVAETVSGAPGTGNTPTAPTPVLVGEGVPLPAKWAPDGESMDLLTKLGLDIAKAIADYRSAMTNERQKRWSNGKFRNWIEARAKTTAVPS